MTSRRLSALGLVVAGVVSVPPGAMATVPLHAGLGGPRDYGDSCLSPNDDGSSAAIDITSAFPQGLQGRQAREGDGRRLGPTQRVREMGYP